MKQNLFTLLAVGMLTANAMAADVPAFTNQTIEANGVSFNMIAVEGGTFQMGATTATDADAQSHESPIHAVTLHDFYIGETEVTQALWYAVTGYKPTANILNNRWSETYGLGENHPAYHISYTNCQTFITELNNLTGLNFRMPTEAEWEYAARGGNKSEGYKYSGSNTIGDVAWCSGNGNSTTHEVKGKAANELGIYDMSGNVLEWCSDWYGMNYYASSPATNPTGPTSSDYSTRVQRGGHWGCNASFCRVSSRSSNRPSEDGSTGNIGLRLVLQPQICTITAAAGEGGTVTGGGEYAVGRTITLTATPNEGYDFSHWTDENNRVVGCNTELTTTITAAKTYTAHFFIDNLLVNGDVSNGSEGWTITGGDVSADGVFKTSARPGTISQYVDIISKGYTQEMLNTNPLLHLGGDIHMPSTKITRDGTVQIIVYCHDASERQIAWITVINDNKVRTSWDWTTFETYVPLPAGTRYLRFVIVGQDMINWAGYYGPQFDNLFARFVPYFTLNTTTSEGGTIAGGGKHAVGKSVTLTATPNEGYAFEKWNDGNTDNPRSITLLQDTTFSATFAPLPTYTITLRAENGTISGAESGKEYYKGTTLTLTATPDEGYIFQKWSDGNTENPRTITVNAETAAVEYVAYFIERGPATAVETVLHGVSGEVYKVFENGTIYILRGGEKYTVDGIRVM